LRAAEVRVLVKSREFKAAATLADSTLDTSETIGDSVAKTLASLAALLGRPKEVASHLRALWSVPEFSRAEFGLVLPPDLAERMADLFADVEGGACTAGSVTALTSAANAVVANVYEPQRRSIVSAALLEDVRIRAAPCTGGISAPPPSVRRPYAGLVAAAVEHDLTAVRAILSRIDALRESHSRSQLSWDVVSLEGWALASAGDLPRAAARIDSSLSGLRYSSAHLTSQPRLAGGLRRTLALRAAIARESGDTATAKYWQQALEELSLISQ